MAEEQELVTITKSHRMRNGNRSTSGDGQYEDDLQAADEADRLRRQTALNRRVVRKLDFLLLPFLSLFFLVNSLDRSNVGNAETANFTEDAGLEPEDLNTAVACFFAFFVALQPVGAALGRRYGMVLWVPSCMVIWGILTAAHVWISAKWQLITIRILIGALEAGFYPVTVSYLSLFYTRFEFAKRLGIFYGQSALAGALGGIISFAVFSKFPMDGEDSDPSGWKPWQILFLLEGCLTIVIALAGYVYLPHGAGSCWFLTTEENRWAELRIVLDREGASIHQNPNRSEDPLSGIHTTDDNNTCHPYPTSSDEARGLLTGDRLARRASVHATTLTTAQGLDPLDVLEAFTDWHVFYLLMMNILSAIPAAAFSVFLPMIIHGFGDFTPQTANLFTAPPFLAGATVLWFFTWLSDRRKQRLIPILYGLAILLAGLTAVVMLPHAHTTLRYISLCILLSGSFVASPLTVAWFAGNIEEPGKRAIVLGINGWGNLAGVFSSLLFAPRFAPNYETPFFVTLGLVMFAFVGFMGFRALIVRENWRRRRVLMAWDDGSLERESREGRGPSFEGVERGSLYARLYRALGIRGDLVGRRGEDKLTFIYGL